MMLSKRRHFTQRRLRLAVNLDPRLQMEIPSSDGISIPGVQRIMRSTNSLWKRILWLFLVASSFLVCIWLLYERLSLYCRAPTLLDSKPTYNKTVVFPAITLCPVQEPFAKASKYYRWLLELAKYNNKTGNVTVEHYEKVNFNKLNFSLRQVWSESYISDEQITIWSSCGLQNGTQTCNYQDGVLTTLTNKTYDTFWGRCRLFIPELSMDYRGPSTFLTIKLNGTLHDKVHKMTGIKYSAKYIIHDRETEHPHDAYMLSSCLSTGWQNAVKLLVKEFNMQNKPNDMCVSTSNWTECYNRNLDENLEEVVNCSLPFMKNRYELPPCQTWHDAREAHKKIKHFYNSFSFSACHCKRKCHEIIYISLAVKLKLNKNDSTLLTLEFADNQIEAVTENYVYGLTSLLSDVSAYVGFFLGVCILTLFELLESLFEKFIKWPTKT